MRHSAWRLCAVAAISSLIDTCMYTLSPKIVEELKITEDRKAIGYWSGFIVAAFYITSAPAGPAWGWLADRYGKALVIRVSLLLSSVFALMCAFCCSLFGFIVLRALSGLCTCVIANCGALAFDMDGKRGTAIATSGWSVAKLIGPGLAGSALQVPLPGLLVGFPFVVPFVSLSLLQVIGFFLVPSESEQQEPESSEFATEQGLAKNALAPQPIADVSPHKNVNHVLLKSLFLNAAVVCVASAMEGVIILYAHGELGLALHTIGYVYVIAGSLEVSLQNTVLLWMVQNTQESKLPKLRRVSLFAYAIPFASLPFCIVRGQSWGHQLALLGFFCGVRTSVGYIFTVANGVIRNNSSKHALGTWSGWAHALNSVAQIVGPPVGTVAFAWSATTNHPFPADHNFTFLCAAFIAMALAAIS